MAISPGEQLVTIQGPNGNTVQVPASLANAFQGATTVQPDQPFADYTANKNAPAPVNPADPAQVTPGTDIKPPVPIVDVKTPSPIATPAGFEQPVTPPGFENAKAPPEPKPKKTAKAAKPSLESAYTPVLDAQQKVQGDVEDQVAGTQQEANVDAARDMLLADARATSNREIDQKAAALQVNAQKAVQAAQAKETEMIGMRKKIADTKIDRTLDHPFLNALGVIIAAIGQGFNRDHGPNPALQIMLNTLDRKVAGQMQNLDQMKDVLGITKDEAARLQGVADHQQSADKLAVSALAEKYARQAEEIGLRASSDKTKVSAQRVAAELRMHGDQAFAQAVQGQVEFDEKKRQADQSNRTQNYAIGSENMRHKQSLAQGQLFHDDQMGLEREKMQNELDLGLARIRGEKGAAGAQQALEMRKTVAERAIGNVSTGEALLTGDGYKMLDKADSFDKEADSLEKTGAMTQEQAARVSKLRDAATGLRGQAKLENTFIAGTGEGTQKLREKYSAAQNIASITDDIKDLYAGKSVLNTDGSRATIQTLKEALDIELKNAWQLGVLSGKDQQKIDKGTGGDPTKYTPGTALNALGLGGEDDEAFKSRLTTLSTVMENKLINDLHNANWDVSDPKRMHLVFHKTKAEDTPLGQAAKEFGKDTYNEKAAAEEGGGTAKQAVQRLFAAGWTSNASERADSIRADENPRYTGAGFTDSQAKAMDTVLAAAKQGDQGAISQLSTWANDNKRPEVARAVVKIVNDAVGDGRVPVEVFDNIRSNATPETAKLIQERDQYAGQRSQLGRQTVPEAVLKATARQADFASRDPAELAAFALQGSTEAYNELAKRAPNSREAQAALKYVMDQNAANKQRKVGTAGIGFTTPSGAAVPAPGGR